MEDDDLARLITAIVIIGVMAWTAYTAFRKEESLWEMLVSYFRGK